MTNSAYDDARAKLRQRLSQDEQRNVLARDRGYPCYDLAHDAVRQEIDDQLESERHTY